MVPERILLLCHTVNKWYQEIFLDVFAAQEVFTTRFMLLNYKNKEDMLWQCWESDHTSSILSSVFNILSQQPRRELASCSLPACFVLVVLSSFHSSSKFNKLSYACDILLYISVPPTHVYYYIGYVLGC